MRDMHYPRKPLDKHITGSKMSHFLISNKVSVGKINLLIAYPVLGSTAIALGFSTSSQISIFRLDPSMLATSILSNK